MIDSSAAAAVVRPVDLALSCGFICRALSQVCSAMSDIGDPLLLLLLLLSMLLLLLLPSSPGARPGDTVRRQSR